MLSPARVVNKLCRVVLARWVLSAGRLDAPSAEITRSLSALADTLAWRQTWVRERLLPLLDAADAGAVLPAAAELARGDRVHQGLQAAIDALSLQGHAESDAHAGTSMARLLQHATLAQAHCLALWHAEDTGWPVRLWQTLPPDRQAALWRQCREALPALLHGATTDLNPMERQTLGDDHA